MVRPQSFVTILTYLFCYFLKKACESFESHSSSRVGAFSTDLIGIVQLGWNVGSDGPQHVHVSTLRRPLDLACLVPPPLLKFNLLLTRIFFSTIHYSRFKFFDLHPPVASSEYWLRDADMMFGERSADYGTLYAGSTSLAVAQVQFAKYIFIPPNRDALIARWVHFSWCSIFLLNTLVNLHPKNWELFDHLYRNCWWRLCWARRISTRLRERSTTQSIGTRSQPALPVPPCFNLPSKF